MITAPLPREAGSIIARNIAGYDDSPRESPSAAATAPLQQPWRRMITDAPGRLLCRRVVKVGTRPCSRV